MIKKIVHNYDYSYIMMRRLAHNWSFLYKKDFEEFDRMIEMNNQAKKELRQQVWFWNYILFYLARDVFDKKFNI